MSKSLSAEWREEAKTSSGLEGTSAEPGHYLGLRRCADALDARKAEILADINAAKYAPHGRKGETEAAYNLGLMAAAKLIKESL